MSTANDESNVNGFVGNEDGNTGNKKGNDDNIGKPFNVIDFKPNDGSDGSEGNAKPKRGRPAKARTEQAGNEKDKEKRVKLSVTGKVLSPKIQGLHALLAAITKQKIFELTESESNELGNAIAEIINHYGLNSTVESVIWGNLIMCIGMIYYPRYLLIKSQKEK